MRFFENMHANAKYKYHYYDFLLYLKLNNSIL